MSRGIADRLNRLAPAECRRELARCCGAAAWVEGMMAARPFAGDQAVLEAAERIWQGLTSADWLEAFGHHPRIGERGGGTWSRQEQSGVATATDSTRRALAQGNREYERRFGHVFLICAAGLSAEQMLAELRRRLANDPALELQVAAAEHAKITRLRLEKLIEP